ncbi:ABC transporter permease [Rhodococcus wratislaviensis]|uniref:ABC transporter permease n=1 Tax=Rhodococcus wratislaviensis TaxID=44752 RepID=UPI0020D0928B|nr:ABC transporter permease subunit [Rhodococcus wratislaviensis]
MTVFVAVLAYIVLAPLWWLAKSAFEDGGAGFEIAYSSSRTARIIWNTAVLAAGSLIVSMIVGTGLAWASTRIPTHAKLLRMVPILPIVIPTVANVVGWAFLLAPGPGYLNAALRNLPWWSNLETGPIDVYSMPWIVIISGMSLASFVYLFVSAGLQNISQEHIEAAGVAGSSYPKTFFTIVVPLLRPALIYGAGVSFLLGLGQFTAPLLLGTSSGVDTITTEMYRSTTDAPVVYGVAAAYGAPILVAGLIVVILQKVSLGDTRRFITHGGKAFKGVDRSSKAAVASIVVYGLLSTVLPIIALTVVAFSRYWSASLSLSLFTWDNVTAVLSRQDIVNAIVTSVVVSVVALAIALPLGFIGATIILRGTRFRLLRVFLDIIVALPLGIPAVVIGAGFLLAYMNPPFVLYGTPGVLILVYVTLMLPYSTRMLLTEMSGLGSQYIEASRVSGAGPVATTVKILAPLMRTSITSAAALMFVLLTHEFSASMLVRSANTQVMGTILFDYYGNGSYPTVAAIALVMTLVTGIGVGIAVKAGGSDVFSKL